MKTKPNYYTFSLIIVILSQLACGLYFPSVGNQENLTNTPLPTLEPPNTELPTVANTPEFASTAMVTAARSLHVREEPGHDTQVVGYLWNDDFVVMTGNCRNGWAEIRWNPGTAWVNADYLSENKCWKK